MAVTPGVWDQAADAYVRAAFQLWFLPWKVVQELRDVTTLESTLFSVATPPGPGDRHRLTLSQPLVPGIPYARQNEMVPISAVRLDPTVLGPGEASFRLLIDADALHHLPGATYRGTVEVTDDASGRQASPPVDVWLVVS